MSSSENLAKPLGRIDVAAPLGVGVKILDGDLKTVVDRTGGDCSVELPIGLYTVRWIAGERSEQRTVRLREGSWFSLEPQSLLSGSPAMVDTQLAEEQFAALVAKLEQPVASTEMIVFVSATDINTSADVARNVQLREIDQGPGRSTTQIEPCHRRCSLAQGWSWRCYGVEPGSYILQFESAERTTLEQTVYAPAGRRTVVWLRYGQAALTERRKSGVQVRVRRGIDSQRTRAVSFGAAVDAFVLKQSLLLADVLLHQLVVRAGTLERKLLDGIGAIDDPYLRLYAGAVLLTRPLLDDDLWTLPEGAPAMWTPPANLAGAHGLFDPLFRQNMALTWPDLLCARWRLALAQNERAFAEAGIELPAPPMLESCWRWAAAWSVERPVVDPASTPGLQALSAGAERTVPWLTWRRAEDRKRVKVPPESPATPDTVVEALRAVSDISARIKGSVVPAAATLSLQTVTLAAAVERIGADKAWHSSEGEFVNRVAGATGLTLDALGTVADTAAKELESTATSDYATLYASDPHAGKFGGQAEVEGCRLSLVTFHRTNSEQFLALDLLVESTRPNLPLEGVVTFYLHPTFDPPVQSTAAINGRATLTCYATGGFTLGAVLANGTRLELDLAKDMRLPKWFRAR